MLSSLSERFYWHDFEVLRYFARHGSRRYWFDEIWDCDWEACREYGRQLGLEGLPPASIRRPPSSVSMLMRTFDRAVARPTDQPVTWPVIASSNPHRYPQP